MKIINKQDKIRYITFSDISDWRSNVNTYERRFSKKYVTAGNYKSIEGKEVFFISITKKDVTRDEL